MLNPLYIAVSWVLLQWHRLFDTFMDGSSGLGWALSILMLVVTIRILLFRFFIKQVHNQRKMQEIQPKIAALRAKYKDDRQTLSQEMMKLQKEEGFNPIGGCLPILLQAPIFLSLFHVLRLIGTDKAHFLADEYHWKPIEVGQAGAAKLFGAPIAATFRSPVDFLDNLNAGQGATRVVSGILIVLMCAATFITQKQIMSRSGQVLDGQQAMIQKLLLYGMPISLFVSGFLFPIGVLLYWFTNNLWTMGQQFYILHRMPPPGGAKPQAPSDAAKALAPRPGQKPVNPKTRRPANAPADETPDTTSANGRTAKATKPAPGTKPAVAGTPGTKPAPGTKAAGAKSGAKAAPAGGAATGKSAVAKAAAPAAKPAARPTKRGRVPAAPVDGADSTVDGSAPDAAASGDPVDPTVDSSALDAAVSGDPVDPTVDSSALDGTAVDGTDGADAPPGGAPSGSPTTTPRSPRRPPARSSSTTTRPKKKRR